MYLYTAVNRVHVKLHKQMRYFATLPAFLYWLEQYTIILFALLGKKQTAYLMEIIYFLL